MSLRSTASYLQAYSVIEKMSLCYGELPHNILTLSKLSAAGRCTELTRWFTYYKL